MFIKKSPKLNKGLELLYIFVVGVIYVIPIIIIFHNFRFYKFEPIFLQFAGLTMIIIGLFFWIWGFSSLGKLFYILPKAIGFTNKGAYKYFENPIYIGIFLTYSGFALCFNNLLLYFYICFLLFPFNLFRIYLENKANK